LIFRGALLYVALRKLGEWKACLLSAACFGVYHWFSMDVLGNPGQMLFLFISTFSWGLMFAFAFSRTGSLYLPIGLHLGWNFMNITVFSQGTLGDQLFIPSGGNAIEFLPMILIVVFQTAALPLSIFFYLKRFDSDLSLEKS
jgi:uncharacterized protein